MTHIMCLTNLAPDIQEAILSLPRVESGPDTMKEIEVRGIARVMDWGVQRVRWREYLSPERVSSAISGRLQGKSSRCDMLC